MRLIAANLAISTFLSVAAIAADQTSYPAKLVTESLLLDVQAAAEQLYVVGERGHILSSSDGTQWQQHEVPTTATLTAFDAVGDKMWVVGHDATILHRSGADQPWQVQMFQPELERPFLDVLFFDETTGIAIGAYGTFYRTQDSGASWQQEMHPEFLHPDDQEYLEEIRLEDEEFYQEELASILPHLNRVSRAGNRLYLAGETGLLAYSDDFGQSWQRMDIDYEGSFFDIVNTPSNRLLAAGLRGNLFEYQVDNQTWSRIESNSTSSMNSIVAIDDQTTLVVGNNGNMVCLTAGQVHQSQTEQSEAIINAAWYQDKLLAVTAGGIQHLDIDPTTGACKKDL